MSQMANVFSSNAFGLISLTRAINLVPFVPNRIEQLGIFAGEGIPTTTVTLEERNGTIALLPTVPRGGNPTKGKTDKRKVRNFTIPHIPYEDAVLPEDVQDVRSFGSSNAMEGVAEVVNNKLIRMARNHDYTLEHLRVGALQGKIYDSDLSTVILNLFTEFGVSEQTADFAFTTTTTSVRARCMAVRRLIEASLGGQTYTGIRALCGANWFDALINHANVTHAYANWSSNEMLRSDPRAGFTFGNITFEEYRGPTAFIDVDQCRFYPEGVPDLLLEYYAPADFWETANTIGLRRYARSEMRPMGRGVDLHTQSNPLPLCTRPAVLIKGTKS